MYSSLMYSKFLNAEFMYSAFMHSKFLNTLTSRVRDSSGNSTFGAFLQNYPRNSAVAQQYCYQNNLEAKTKKHQKGYCSG